MVMENLTRKQRFKLAMILCFLAMVGFGIGAATFELGALRNICIGGVFASILALFSFYLAQWWAE